VTEQDKDGPVLSSLRNGLCVIAACCLAGHAMAASCGNTSAGFEAWKADFAKVARKSGVKKRGLQALAGAQYATRTIAADRNQKSFKYTLDKFMRVRGADTIVAQARKRKARNPGFYQALERQYGVPSGILLAIHGMETAFGNYMGDSQVVSAIVTLTFDCRRSDFFRPHAIGALKLVDSGAITSGTRGAKHGELGHTQFLPGNALKFGVDGNGDGRVDFYNVTDAMASTANFLRAKGWKPGRGYQQGEPNFQAIKAWNAASVYQQSIAIMAARIDR
jgi:membrane-bound lytic murein transglycosylase B